MKVTYHLCRIILGFVFLYASYHKILRPDQFAESMSHYRILPYYLVNLFAVTLPYIEALFGAFLIFNIFIPAAAMAVSFMTGIFLTALLLAFMRGIDLGCGCFSASAEPISISQIFRDVLFLAMGIYVYMVSMRGEPSLARHNRKVD